MGWDPWEDIKKAADEAVSGVSNTANSTFSDVGNWFNQAASDASNSFNNATNLTPRAPSAPAAPSSGWVAPKTPTPNTSSAGAVQSGITDAQGKISGLESQYPAYPNSYGLGGPMGSPGSFAGGNQPPAQTTPTNTSQGFNPWSLTGEANARG